MPSTQPEPAAIIYWVFSKKSLVDHGVIPKDAVVIEVPFDFDDLLELVRSLGFHIPDRKTAAARR